MYGANARTWALSTPCLLRERPGPCKAPSIWSTSPCPAAEAGAGTEKVGGCKYTGSAAAFYYKEADCMINWYYPPSTAPIPPVLCTGGTPIPP